VNGFNVVYNLNFLYFTPIKKQVISTYIMISLVGSDGGARASFVWEETRVPGENPRDRAVDDLIDTRNRNTDRNRIALVKSECATRLPDYPSFLSDLELYRTVVVRSAVTGANSIREKCASTPKYHAADKHDGG